VRIRTLPRGTCAQRWHRTTEEMPGQRGSPPGPLETLDGMSLRGGSGEALERYRCPPQSPLCYAGSCHEYDSDHDHCDTRPHWLDEVSTAGRVGAVSRDRPRAPQANDRGRSNPLRPVTVECGPLTLTMEPSARGGHSATGSEEVSPEAFSQSPGECRCSNTPRCVAALSYTSPLAVTVSGGRERRPIL
jgi:hypothetical protein